jgi:predicted nucleic acid-binding protein
VTASLLPDESYRDVALRILRGFLSEDLELFTVPLLRYELTNSLWKAIGRARVKLDDAVAVLKEFEAFNLPEREVSSREALKLAHAYNCSAYDAVYLALAQAEQAPLVTADRHLYNALKDRFRWLLWIEDFKG